MRFHELATLLRPSLVGAAYMGGVALVTARRAAADERLMGVAAADVAHAIATTFADHVRDATLLVAAIAVLFGGALGAGAGALVRLRAALGGAPPRDGLALVLRACPLVVALHAALLAYGMAQRPQPYMGVFYERGGVLRVVQILANDVLGPRGVVAVVALGVLGYLFLPPSETISRARAFGRLPQRLRGWKVVLAVSATALVFATFAGPPRRRRSDPRPNVLVLAADSLRGDRVDPRTAPRLAALAGEGASFAHAYTSLPRTFPAWVTRLTGRYPHHHGIRTMFPSREARARPLDALPPRLEAAGYATSVASDYAGDVFPRAAFGFMRVDAPTFHFGEVVRQRALEAQVALWPLLGSALGRALLPSVRGMSRAADAADVSRRSLAAIDAAGDRPFFHVAFYSTAHFPYASPWPGYARFTRPAYRGRFKYEKANVLGRELPPDADDVAQIRALYDGAVSVVDEAAGRLLDGLEDRGLTRDTIVILTADHGETLFEGDRGQGHGDHLFGREALRVPLAIVDHRAPARREIGGVARDVDLAPTIYELTGVPPAPGLDGVSLVSATRSGATEANEAFAETGLWFTADAVPGELRIPYPDVSRMLEVRRDAGDDVVLQDRFLSLTTMAKHRAIITPTHELVLAPTRFGLRTLLFDLTRDPHCRTDLAATEIALGAPLRARLLAWVLQDRDLALAGEHLVWRGRRGDDAHAGVRLEAP